MLFFTYSETINKRKLKLSRVALREISPRSDCFLPTDRQWTHHRLEDVICEWRIRNSHPVSLRQTHEREREREQNVTLKKESQLESTSWVCVDVYTVQTYYTNIHKFFHFKLRCTQTHTGSDHSWAFPVCHESSLWCFDASSTLGSLPLNYYINK